MVLQLDNLTTGEGSGRRQVIKLRFEKMSALCDIFNLMPMVKIYSDSSSFTFKRNICTCRLKLFPQDPPSAHVNPSAGFDSFCTPPQHFYSCRCCWVKLAFVQPSPLCASVSLLNVLMNLAELSPQDKERRREKKKNKANPENTEAATCRLSWMTQSSVPEQTNQSSGHLKKHRLVAGRVRAKNNNT